ncbi:acetyl-CoA carboxylase biotin carboxyl carrier protein subunit [Autumnicola musiva]|uniref:Acetyl-CoA carboxylase biotin carboxyl carrier protein subunit n=1 Tax=Autumnicola musiva TaxID=3075589 RepID=A0ABU3D526_9FLAO|nr:acetyl-CoA carboxylase biotin carboxyl carrier protein subunit [Zunongwangia sp. F117]MDT0676631.1 acetyl-CoA carboxylase biotin carboxyl carrier protein subunit [Zunongwangia sp. F117]
MEKIYKIKVNTSYDFEFTREEIETLDQQQVSASGFHVLKDNRSFKAKILNSDFNRKKYSVKINSNIYEVDIANELDLLIEAMGLSLGSAQLMNDIKAPMPGLILDVNVQEGDEVQEGDTLLVLEAMKMENTLTAPGVGVIKSVHVKKGQGVEKNQLLIELE